MPRGESEEFDFSGMTLEQKVDRLLEIGVVLVPAVRRLEASRRWLRIAMGSFVVSGAVVIGLVVGLYASFHSQSNQADCFRQWATEYTSQAQEVRSANSQLTDASDDVFRALPRPGSSTTFDQNRFDTALAKYFVISDSHRQALHDNPIPDPPKFNC